MAPTPPSDHLALTITVHVDPPLPDGDTAHRVGQQLANLLAGSGAATSHATDEAPDRITWMVPLEDEDAELVDLLRATDTFARDLLAREGARTVQVLALEAVDSGELQRRGEQRARGLDQVGIDEFRELLAPPGQERISRQRFYQLRDRADFPQPVRRGLWQREVARQFADGRRRHPDPTPSPVVDDAGARCPVCQVPVERDEPIDVTTRADAQAGRSPTQLGRWSCPNGCDPRAGTPGLGAPRAQGGEGDQ